MRYRNTAYRTSFCALMAALGAAFMLTGNLIPVLTYVSPMLAGMTLIPVLYEFGKKSAWMTWAVTAALAMMLCADREEAFFYLFTGFYPIIKPDLDRIRSKSLRFLAKLAVFTVSIACMVLILLFVVGMTDIREELWLSLLFYAMMIGLMFLYDRTCAVMTLVYAGGRRRHCGITAAVGESEEQRKPERFSGHRKAVETDRERPTLDNCICAEVELSSRLQVTAPRIVQGERSAEE